MLRDAIEGIPSLHEKLSEMYEMFDVHYARTDGIVRLAQGRDLDYDSAMTSKVRPFQSLGA